MFLKRSVLLVMVLLAAVWGLTGCASRSMQTSNPLQSPMVQAAYTLGEVGSLSQKGDVKGARTAYERFAKEFGEVLGPVSMKDPKLAQALANANTALKAEFARSNPDKAAVVRESAALARHLQEAAVAMGVTLVSQPASASAEVAAARVIDVTAVNYRFQPSRIEVRKGEKITIRMKNAGTERHEFELDAFGVEIKPIAPGATGAVTFVADKAGTFEYACHVDGHYEKGMKGYLVVK